MLRIGTAAFRAPIEGGTVRIPMSILKKSTAVFCAAALGATALFGCTAPAESSDGAASQDQAQEAEDRTVVDMRGDEITVPADTSTVLTVNSVATQMVLMLGGEDAAATMGKGFNYGEGSLNASMFPGLADVPTFSREDSTVENIAAIGPDFVLEGNDDVIAQLRDAGIPAAYISVTSPETIVEAVHIIGDALGGEADQKAQAYEDAYNEALEDTKARTADLSDDDKPRVLYMRSTESTTGANSMPDSWITAAGGINAAAEAGFDGSGAEINAETIMNIDPDIIICESQDVADQFLSDAAYSELAAVQSGKVYAAPFGTAVWSMGTAETLLQLSWAGTIINPDLFSDVDLDAVTSDFYQEFFGYELSQDELDGIFHR